jgi:hypothetical protein
LVNLILSGNLRRITAVRKYSGLLGAPGSKELADLGVARISYGGGSYRTTMETFKRGRVAFDWKVANA